MDIQTIVDILLPYWILGVFVIAATVASGNKSLIRVEKMPLVKWMLFLGLVTLYRLGLSRLFPHFHGFGGSAEGVTILPWQVTLGVFWEDACHGLPMLLLKKLLPKTKKAKVLYGFILGLVMFEFGLGHLYQGALPAALLSLYIPYSIKTGEKYGFGTVMVGHILYDLVTVLFVRYLFGL